MMTINNILRHEFIGLKCVVVDASNKSLVNLKGKVINETMKTIVLLTGHDKKIVPKKGTIFQIMLNGKKINIDGSKILLRPEQRIKKLQKMW